MNKDIDSRVKQAVKELGVDKPIMSYRVVGDRVELHLLGGSIVRWPAIDDPEDPLSDSGLDFWTLKEIKNLASIHKIPGRSKMNRDQLIEALRKVL